MKSIHILATLIVATLAVCFSGQTIAQNKQSDASISGHIIDAKTGEHLPYVTVMVGGTQIGIQTSSSGHYVLRNLPLGKHDIIASFVGYKDATISLDIEAGKSYEVNFSLEEESLSLDGVVVSATRNRTSRKMAPTLVNVIDSRISPPLPLLLWRKDSRSSRESGSRTTARTADSRRQESTDSTDIIRRFSLTPDLFFPPLRACTDWSRYPHQ